MTEEVLDDIDEPPEAPSESDCCNSGCSPCVYDIYESQLLKWKNKEMLGRKLKKIRCDLLSETKFKPFILLHKTNITYNACLLRFQPKITGDSSSTTCGNLEQKISGLLPYTVGQHFVMKNDGDCSSQCMSKSALCETSESIFNCIVATEVKSSELSLEDRTTERNDQSFTTKAYTPITLSVEESDCCFNIVVKLYREGKMSNYIESLKVGDVTYFRGPYGDFIYNTNAFKEVFMICMGTGIAPMYTVIKHILSDENDETLIKLLYSSRNVEDILLRNELKNFTSYWNFTLKYFITGEVSGRATQKFGENFVFSRINEIEILKEFTHKSVSDWSILICGNNEFSDTVLNICIQYGISRRNIHVF